MRVRFLAAGLALALAVPAFAQQTAGPAAATVAGTAGPGSSRVISRSSPRRHRLEDRSTTRERTCIGQPDHARRRFRIPRGPTSAICCGRCPASTSRKSSARDVNLTARGATSTLATSQLALVDGRSVYLDFFGMVMWDLVPTNANEIKQIEVIRGPASAVWGANAMSGVVNVITHVAARAGRRRRIVGDDWRRLLRPRRDRRGQRHRRALLRQRHPRRGGEREVVLQAVGGLLRPGRPAAADRHDPQFIQHAVSAVRRTAARRSRSSTPAWTTSWRTPEGSSFSGGVAGTEGIIHSGIGPFDINSGSRLTYFSGRYQKGGRHIGILHQHPQRRRRELPVARGLRRAAAAVVRHDNLRHRSVRPPDLRHPSRPELRRQLPPQQLRHLDCAQRRRSQRGRRVRAGRDLPQRPVQMGGRRPSGQVLVDRQRGLLAADDVHVQAVAQSDGPGSRSTARSARPPSSTTTSMSSLLNQANLSAISPALSQFVFPFRAVGNPDLEQETMTAYEIGYTGILGRRATVTAAVYWNTTDDAIFFTQVDRYTAANPPVTWPPSDPDLRPEPDSAARAAVALHLSQPGDSQRQGHRARRRWRGQSICQCHRELLLSGGPRRRRIRPERDELPGQQSLQRRLQLQLRAVPRKLHGQLYRRGLLAGRARSAFRRGDRGLHVA